MSPTETDHPEPEQYPPSGAPPEPPQPDVVAHLADFAELKPPDKPGGGGSLQNLLNVNVAVTAELGRVTLAIGDVLKLGIGSVVELDRAVSDPVDLLVQGVRLARGEVVVVNDHFAVRIKEIADPKKRQ